MLQVDAVVVTDRELMLTFDFEALEELSRLSWLADSPGLSFSRAITVAWILEPPVITTEPYHHVLSNPHAFDLVFSHSEEFLAQLPVCVYVCMCARL